mmetsp:Transcript_12806/g.9283  ORF Transcript_12806/g.9283 Transcript_12806/m.9283 type:complete len:158 (-) Transcript_12806:58-531(-)|eukprot:CAMPEP_0202977472 /NCGR_PEP_ID=MMETSP1396-20130829/84268_1 /ASSEMBLY_ACC=CAM_ASM_000872 /TAXON_ID= /ORGANISM="Pseudokeronopsis sp., Strain Brazil" /LENGTH=157 /DNA_ID=CAMNT_0049716221 /DNA_START=808 /DNA_END=1281 /DNA_ORIENTATION=-
MRLLFIALALSTFVFAQDPSVEDCFSGTATEIVKEKSKVGLPLGLEMKLMASETCTFYTQGNIMIQYWASELDINYYTYSGEGDVCTPEGASNAYKSAELLQTKRKVEQDGVCGYLFYMTNQNTEGFAYTIDVFREGASFLTSTLIVVVGTLFALIV